MPELPDIVVYIEHLKRKTLGQPISRFKLINPFFLRTVDPPISLAEQQTVNSLTRLGKRIVFGLTGDLFLVIHLMVAGRLRWRTHDDKPLPRKLVLATIQFPSGVLYVTEAGTKRRASLHVVAGQDSLAQFQRGGLEVLEASLAEYSAMLRSENHTLKRALTDPSLFSGIGNAYSDEILHRARLSPLTLTGKLTDEEIERLYHATRETLNSWVDRLMAETADEFPETVTAFREGMAVHGRFKRPCPVCRSPVQRIRYADNETNYCAMCQTKGRLLADRALSRLLKKDWPRSLDGLE